jgi:hypothetical protein
VDDHKVHTPYDRDDEREKAVAGGHGPILPDA